MLFEVPGLLQYNLVQLHRNKVILQSLRQVSRRSVMNLGHSVRTPRYTTRKSADASFLWFLKPICDFGRFCLHKANSALKTCS